MVVCEGLPSRSWRVKYGNLGESRVALVNEDEDVGHAASPLDPVPNDEEQSQSPFRTTTEWPQAGRLFPIWTLQLIYPLILCFFAIAPMASGYSKSVA